MSKFGYIQKNLLTGNSWLLTEQKYPVEVDGTRREQTLG